MNKNPSKSEVLSEYYPRINAILSIIDGLYIKRGAVYVDLGCGDGTLTRLLAERISAKIVWGVDINEQRLSLAARKGIRVIKADLNKDVLPIERESVDLVTAFEIIEHLYNPDNLISEVYRILKPSGHFVLSTPNLASWVNRLKLLLGRHPTYLDVSINMPSRSLGHIRLYTLEALRTLLESYGLKVVKLKGSSSSYKVPRIVRVIDNILGNLRPSLSRILIIAAKKL